MRSSDGTPTALEPGLRIVALPIVSSDVDDGTNAIVSWILDFAESASRKTT
jgi:hypothetical protein